MPMICAGVVAAGKKTKISYVELAQSKDDYDLGATAQLMNRNGIDVIFLAMEEGTEPVLEVALKKNFMLSPARKRPAVYMQLS